MHILVTGATGNVGIEVIRTLSAIDHQHEIFAGVRNIKEAASTLAPYPNIRCSDFDFDKRADFKFFLKGMDVLFLLRPPHISNVTKYFKPLIEVAQNLKLKHIVFLSVQGVEKSSIIPHHKIEKLIEQSCISFSFLRAAYFMQNFSTILRKDIIEKDRIYLPAGKVKFNLIDVKDVGEVAAKILINPQNHKNKAYDLTNYEQIDFQSICMQLSKGIGRKIEFVSPNLMAFFIQKRMEGMATPFILVMIMLHYLPRFQKNLSTSDWTEKFLGRQPTTFEEFVEREKSEWL